MVVVVVGVRVVLLVEDNLSKKNFLSFFFSYSSLPYKRCSVLGAQEPSKFACVSDILSIQRTIIEDTRTNYDKNQKDKQSTTERTGEEKGKERDEPVTLYRAYT